MTTIGHLDEVVCTVAINDHPLIVGESDDRSDDELVEAVESRTETADDLTFPGWDVFESDPPDDETIRYADTPSRINVLTRYGDETDVFEEVADRIEIDGFDMEEAAMSHPSAVHADDFDGDIHLDLT